MVEYRMSETVLHRAIMHNAIDLTNNLIKRGADVNAIFKYTKQKLDNYQQLSQELKETYDLNQKEKIERNLLEQQGIKNKIMGLEEALKKKESPSYPMRTNQMVPRKKKCLMKMVKK